MRRTRPLTTRSSTLTWQVRMHAPRPEPGWCWPFSPSPKNAACTACLWVQRVKQEGCEVNRRLHLELQEVADEGRQRAGPGQECRQRLDGQRYVLSRADATGVLVLTALTSQAQASRTARSQSALDPPAALWPLVRA